MGLFSKREKPDDGDAESTAAGDAPSSAANSATGSASSTPSTAGSVPSDAIANVTALAQLRFSGLGLPVQVDPETAGSDTVLVGEDGSRYPLYNLLARTANLTGEPLMLAIMDHVDTIVAARSEAAVGDLSDEEFRALVRTRVVRADTIDESTSYAIAVSADLACVLCLDFPSSVTFLTDADLAGRDIDDLFAVGLRNVMAEPIQLVDEAAPGVTRFVGDSFFTASKMLGMSQLIAEHLPAASHGVFFGVPNRHLIYTVAPTSMDFQQQLTTLATLVAGNARTSEDAGGGLSPHIFIWRAGEIELAGVVDAAGKLQMHGQGRTLEMLEELTALG